MNKNRYVVRKWKIGQEPALAHNGMIFSDHASQRLVRNYAAHGYRAERVDVTGETRENQTFYDSL